MKFAENVATIEGNAVFEDTKRASVDNESLPHIIRSLTDMYSNPLLAVAREYISNAYDATVERMETSGSFGTVLDTPIEVSLPTSLNPNFIVRDYGTGMDRSVLSDVFLTYGASTKRDTNSQIGGFGLGSKSALAIAENFTVISVKDGKKNVGIIQKGEDGVGEISFLPEMETDEPSGTVVTISLSPDDSHRLNILFNTDTSLLMGFPHGSIKINGKMHNTSVFNPDHYTRIGDFGYMPIEIMTPRGKLFTRPLPSFPSSADGFSVLPRYNDNESGRTVLVGPISYRVNSSDLKEVNIDRIHRWFKSNPGIITLPIGSVDITPARENLIFSDRTCNAILNAAEQIQTDLISRIATLLNSCSTRQEALRFMEKATQFVRIGSEDRASLTWNAEVVPNRDWSLLVKDEHPLWITNMYTGSSRFNVHRCDPWQHAKRISENLKIIMVTGLKKTETQDEYTVASKMTSLASHVLQDQFGVKLIDPSFAANNLKTEGGTVVFTSAEDVSIYGEWFDSIVGAVIPADEFVARGKKLRSQANKAAREALAKDNLMVTRVDLGNKREAVVQSKPSHASWFKDRKVAYIQFDEEKPDSIGSRIAKSLSAPKSKAEISRAELGAYMHWCNETVFILLSPTHSVKDLLEVVPKAVSIDSFLREKVEEMLRRTDSVSLCYEKYEGEYSWVSPARAGRMVASVNNPQVSKWVEGEKLDPILKEIKNPEVRKFLEQVSRAKAVRGPEYYLALFESPLFEKEFSKLRKEVESLHARFSLPMVKHLAHPNHLMLEGKKEMEKQLVSYVNMLYPS